MHNTLKPFERKVGGLIHLKVRKLLGKPNALFSSVFRNADPSNLKGSLLEGNKDCLLNLARSDLAKQELHVESISASVNLNDKRKSEDWPNRTHNTDLLNLDENKFDYKKNFVYERKRFSEILKCEICTKWEKLRELKNDE